MTSAAADTARTRAAALLSRLAREEDGAMTILGLYVLAGAFVVSALAIDFAYLMASQTQLQVAADSAAHAALYYRDTHDADDARARAVAIAKHDLPESARYGNVLRPDDVEFGWFDYATRSFTPSDHIQTAARVRPSRAAASGNPVASIFFKLVDKDWWDIRTEAVFTTFSPPCLREGFVAEGIVDIQSNNGFASGFCVHSNTYVSLNSNNTFEPGTVVSMPDLDKLDMPKSGFERNEGLQVALRTGYYRLRVLRKIDEIHADITSGMGRYAPNYIQGLSPIHVDGRKMSAGDFVTGRIHHIHCSGGKLNFPGGLHLRRMVLITDCEVKFGQNVVLEDVVFFNTNTSDKSFNAASSLQLGVDDNCAAGGGAQLVTRGGVNVASDLRLYGGQIIALKNIEFAANAHGIQGASLVSGQQIDGTSNMDMGFCGAGMEQNFEASYFRLAR